MGGCTRDMLSTEQRIPGYRQIPILKYFQSKHELPWLMKLLEKLFQCTCLFVKEDQRYYTSRLFFLSSRSRMNIVRKVIVWYTIGLKLPLHDRTFSLALLLLLYWELYFEKERVVLILWVSDQGTFLHRGKVCCGYAEWRICSMSSLSCKEDCAWR